MSEVIGFEAKTFTFEDGKSVNGFFLFLAEKRPGVTGTACERVFVSTPKLNGYLPVIGDNITVNYNRFGKPQSIYKEAVKNGAVPIG